MRITSKLRNDIESFGFVGAEMAGVEVERLNIRHNEPYTCGWHGEVKNKELIIYTTDKTQKGQIISKIATALSKKSRYTKKEIQAFIKKLN